MTISPMTPPGTEIVCINDTLDDFVVLPAMIYGGDLDGLTKGKIYTVRDIVPINSCYYNSDFEVVLNEIIRNPPDEGFAIERFRYLDLAGFGELLEVKVEKNEPVKIKTPA